MQYMGGKGRVGRHISQILIDAGRDRSHYLEPFVGGASVFATVAPHFERATAADVIPDLVLMWQAARDGWVPPESLTRDEYGDLRASAPSALRGFAGFGCSFGGKWWGGYAANARGDNFARAASRGVVRKARGLAGAAVVLADYRSWSPGPADVVYCDPPYAGTTGYVGAGTWDADEFWAVAEKWSRNGAAVFVSEYTAPAAWRTAWSAEAKRSLRADSNTLPSVEHLFTFSPEDTA